MKKHFEFCLNWKIKHNWGSGGTMSPSVGSLGDQGAKPIGKFYLKMSMSLNTSDKE